MAIKKNNPKYNREQGKRSAVGFKSRTIAFSLTKLDINQGQSIEEWEEDGLLSQLLNMMRQVGQYELSQALAQQMIKQYTKVGFPPNSEFIEPKHILPNYWAVMHIKPRSKSVVAGFIENDIFYIVFLDREHKFWPTKDIQNRKKQKR